MRPAFFRVELTCATEAQGHERSMESCVTNQAAHQEFILSLKSQPSLLLSHSAL